MLAFQTRPPPDHKELWEGGDAAGHQDLLPFALAEWEAALDPDLS